MFPFWTTFSGPSLAIKNNDTSSQTQLLKCAEFSFKLIILELSVTIPNVRWYLYTRGRFQTPTSQISHLVKCSVF